MKHFISSFVILLFSASSIFAQDAAKQFSTAKSKNMKAKLAEEITKTEDEKFLDISFETFTTEDIAAGKGNYAGGMTKLNGKLNPAITFYKVELLREVGATSGMAYKYWTFINSKWVFLPKPYSAFKSAQ
jgi:hypothetical protein